MDRCRGLAKHTAVLGALLLVMLIQPAALRGDDSDNQPPPKRQLTPAELLRKRINESLSGLRDSRAPQAQVLAGPDLTEREKVILVLNRLTFGPRPGEVDEVLKNGGWEAWVKQQLDPDKIDDATCERVIAQRFPWTKMSIEQMHQKYGDDKDDTREMVKELPEMVLTQAVLSNREFKEVMCDFWRNHFCVDQPRAGEEKSRSWTDADYEMQVVRKFAMVPAGKNGQPGAHFGDMLFASARHPAMLEYLDNKLSRANEWNENYAREVMELHTVGADRGYGNLDVLELSKALTGWTYNNNYQFEFRQNWHQPGYKFWMGMRLPQGYEGGAEALRVLATHPNTAQFISEKLCRYLVNDNPPPALVHRVAGVFRESKGELNKVYWAIISSKEFMSRDNYRSKFKTPFQFTVSALRSTNASVDDVSQVCETLRRMGEPIYDCPDPTGYRDQAESWMDAGVLTTRWQFSWDLSRGAIQGVSVPQSFWDRYKSLKPDETEAKMIEDLIGGEIGDRELVALKDAATSGDLQRMAGILMGSPSFQQR